MENLARYIIRVSFSQERMTCGMRAKLFINPKTLSKQKLSMRWSGWLPCVPIYQTGVMTRPQDHTPHIVSPICSLKIITTTMMDSNQEAEIINTTKRMVRKIPMKSCSLSISSNMNFSAHYKSHHLVVYAHLKISCNTSQE